MSSQSGAGADQNAIISALRLRVVRVGLVISALLLIAFGAEANRLDELGEATIWVPILALGVALVALMAVPWQTALRAPIGNVLILLWAACLVVGLVSAGDIRAEPPLVVGFAAILVFTAALVVPPIYQLLATTAAGVGYLVALARSDLDPSGTEIALQLLAIAVVGVLTVVLAGAIRRHLVATADQLEDLRQREIDLRLRQADLNQLYDISRTIGAGTSLAEVLPELVSRIAQAVGAKVGVVLFYAPQAQALEVVSPIWVTGHALRADTYVLPLTESGIAQRVFISSDAAFVNDADEVAREPLLADLGAEKVAAVPLRVEANAIGVLLITDKSGGDFDREDVETLESLAAPAALILNHLARFREAQEASQKMAEIARLKTDFVSVVSHELRTPLTSIIGSLATLNRPQLAPADPSARQLLETARRQADRLKALIEDLLVVSRLDERAIPQRPTDVNVGALAHEVVATLIEGPGPITLDFPADLPTVETDEEHLRRVLTNLIENALKYAPESTVEIIGREMGDEVWISVVDHGPGIPYELHDHIFERFTQVHGADTRVSGGSGLGLSIVRGLTEAMGGRVWFEPTLGGGSTFITALPRHIGAYGMVRTG